MKKLLNTKDRNTILKRLNRLSETDAPLWGTMNASQMLCHLTDQIRSATGEINAKDISNWKLRSIGKYWGLWDLPIPKGIRTVPEYNSSKRGTQTAGFDEDMRLLKEIIEKVVKVKTPPAHPAFGPLSSKQWCRLAYVHINYHLKQFNL